MKYLNYFTRKKHTHKKTGTGIIQISERLWEEEKLPPPPPFIFSDTD